jgi:hypothetical protein
VCKCYKHSWEYEVACCWDCNESEDDCKCPKEKPGEKPEAEAEEKPEEKPAYETGGHTCYICNKPAGYVDDGFKCLRCEKVTCSDHRSCILYCCKSCTVHLSFCHCGKCCGEEAEAETPEVEVETPEVEVETPEVEVETIFSTVYDPKISVGTVVNKFVEEYIKHVVRKINTVELGKLYV